jgi:hypothetical protein
MPTREKAVSLKDFLAELEWDREARTRRERHGQGEITFLNNAPIRATGCTLPDGSLTDADCLLPHVPVPDEAQRVWTRRLPGAPLPARPPEVRSGDGGVLRRSAECRFRRQRR